MHHLGIVCHSMKVLTIINSSAKWMSIFGIGTQRKIKPSQLIMIQGTEQSLFVLLLNSFTSHVLSFSLNNLFFTNNFRFLLRPNASNLAEEVLTSIKVFENQKFLQLAMDGPSTNWNVLEHIDDERVANVFQKTLNIGSCSLHILHGAFQTGMSKANWEMSKILKALYKLFNESPARRDVYLREGESTLFPLKFSATRWIEDQQVADRALEVWPSVVATVKYWLGLCKSKQPKNNKNFDILVECHQDLLIPAKFHFFSFVAGILKPYLVVFQSDNPLVPFMFDELSQILYRLLGLVFKKSKIDRTIKLRRLMKEEFLTNPSNQLEEYLIDIGAAAKDVIGKLNIATEKSEGFGKTASRLFWGYC